MGMPAKMGCALRVTVMMMMMMMMMRMRMKMMMANDADDGYTTMTMVIVWQKHCNIL